MHTVNGKLLGQPYRDADILKQQLDSLYQDVNGVKNFLLELEKQNAHDANSPQAEVMREALLRQVEAFVQLEQRCENIENGFQLENQQQEAYYQEVRATKLLLKQLESRLASLENNKFNQLESQLMKLGRTPRKLLWLALSLSLALGTFGLWSWSGFYPFSSQLQLKQHFNSSQAVEPELAAIFPTQSKAS